MECNYREMDLSNPKLPSKNIPLPPRRDPDLFSSRAEGGGGWAAATLRRAGYSRGQADGRGGQVQLTGLGRPLHCSTMDGEKYADFNSYTLIKDHFKCVTRSCCAVAQNPTWILCPDGPSAKEKNVRLWPCFKSLKATVNSNIHLPTMNGFGWPTPSFAGI